MERVKWLEEEIKKMLADNSYRGCILKSVKRGIIRLLFSKSV